MLIKNEFDTVNSLTMHQVDAVPQMSEMQLFLYQLLYQRRLNTVLGTPHNLSSNRNISGLFYNSHMTHWGVCNKGCHRRQLDIAPGQYAYYATCTGKYTPVIMMIWWRQALADSCQIKSSMTPHAPPFRPLLLAVISNTNLHTLVFVAPFIRHGKGGSSLPVFFSGTTTKLLKSYQQLRRQP